MNEFNFSPAAGATPKKSGLGIILGVLLTISAVLGGGYYYSQGGNVAEEDNPPSLSEGEGSYQGFAKTGLCKMVSWEEKDIDNFEEEYEDEDPEFTSKTRFTDVYTTKEISYKEVLNSIDPDAESAFVGFYNKKEKIWQIYPQLGGKNGKNKCLNTEDAGAEEAKLTDKIPANTVITIAVEETPLKIYGDKIKSLEKPNKTEFACNSKTEIESGIKGWNAYAASTDTPYEMFEDCLGNVAVVWGFVDGKQTMLYHKDGKNKTSVKKFKDIEIDNYLIWVKFRETPGSSKAKDLQEDFEDDEETAVKTPTVTVTTTTQTTTPTTTQSTAEKNQNTTSSQALVIGGDMENVNKWMPYGEITLKEQVKDTTTKSNVMHIKSETKSAGIEQSKIQVTNGKTYILSLDYKLIGGIFTVRIGDNDSDSDFDGKRERVISEGKELPWTKYERKFTVPEDFVASDLRIVITVGPRRLQTGREEKGEVYIDNVKLVEVTESKATETKK